MNRSSALVKAPPGVKVYCLDGSLLLNDSDKDQCFQFLVCACVDLSNVYFLFATSVF